MNFRSKLLYILFTVLMFLSPVTKLVAAVIERTRYSDSTLDQKTQGYQFLEQSLTTDLHAKHQSHASHVSHSSHYSSGSNGSGGSPSVDISSLTSTTIKKYLKYTSQQYDSFSQRAYGDFFTSEARRGFGIKKYNFNYLLNLSPFNSYTALPYVYEDKTEYFKFYVFIPYVLRYSLANTTDELESNTGIGDLILGTLLNYDLGLNDSNLGISLSLPTGRFGNAIKNNISPLGSGNFGIQLSLDASLEAEKIKWVQYAYLTFRSTSTVTVEDQEYDIFIPFTLKYDNFLEKEINKNNTLSLFVKSTLIPYGSVSENDSDSAELYFLDIIITPTLEYNFHLRDYQIKIGLKLPSLNSAEYESSSKADINIQFKLNDPVNFISNIYKKVRN